MRLNFTFATVVVGTISAAAPAAAQTYDKSYPFCLEAYGGRPGGYIECRYASMAQCAASASGRGATCRLNPYYADGKFRSAPFVPAAARSPWR
ncbi:MAG: DUF3551 domain-containing protein [Bradyrhizobium sp.]|uniref:DUF3551 domain-containing protein n=1 Tax=Bradyrhizobium sp. TaxID=376 RepID=UPI0025C48F63|nr:DUF3551 domain-containing protein [Bradyrhizobium sp.]MBI5265494.1 DUF3551 domain-containing protein [Bradyrhizobium sp.]